MTAISIVAHSYPFVVGVDTHARNHVYAILAARTGELIDTRDFPTTSAGINRAIAWVARRTDADADTLWVIEGAASYGAVLAGAVAAEGYPVAEAPRMDAKKRHGVGKSDALDAHHIAAAALPLPQAKLCRPRLNEGVRQALRILVTARDAMSAERTRSVNSLTALLRTNDLGLDARRALSAAQIAEASRWRAREEELSLTIARTEATRLAKRVLELDDQLKANDKQVTELVQISEAAPLLHEKGFGSVTAATCLTAWSHQGRVRNEAAYASLAGVNPIPASSGNTVRHRLNRGGDRNLNRALHMVALTKMTHDEETRRYVEKRRTEGRTDREIRRCIKRYLARRVHRTLNAASPCLKSA
ncbi:IS110 family transposase [Arthrobacter crystallopoietes]|uniref:Transposase n=1 Tax=Crystallibacter crystallopoietes TaxID=37928 RepID=A0A1H0ZXQ7_9MICC|nr:IS110 family transposase [Arthrobacter crystallopoietes]SDQ32162.1 Transposase [Arthrobacter crystallopoietes]SDQ35300.1 Transposase [Arthrobacter crystallopoietes]SDQ38394.1 Transposase [Arthrobacter crystallopoietes]SDQ40044.1 Transposase [Arthrobacter crystallopoietes]SDQ46465.1 Transposase [Arthrobacter crystallopoietes]